MRRRAEASTLVFTLLVLLPWPTGLLAQKPPSLEEQLRAQYEPETVLTIQKEGILGVALSSKVCPARYQDGTLNRPDASCATAAKPSRALTVGENISPSKIEVDLAKERISFGIVGCDSCNTGTQSSSYKSQVDFQFGKGYLEKASVSQIEDTISEVLAFQEAADQPAPTPGPPEQIGGDGQQAARVAANNPPASDTALTASSPESAAEWLGFANETVSRDREAELHQNCGADFRRVYVPHDAGNKFSDLCNYEGKTCEKVCDWEGRSFPCSAVSLGGRRDGTRIVLCRPGANRYANDQNTDERRFEGRQGNTSAASAPVTTSFSVRHRHTDLAQSFLSKKSVEHYCSGTLSISPDGTVAYECAQTDDPSGRCEHVSFAPGALKQVKIGSGGNLHIESKTQGKFDFYGNQNDIQQAQAAIAPLVLTTQK